MEKKEGPSLQTIPAQEFLSCYGCVFHGQYLFKSGYYPSKKHMCKNTVVFENGSRFLESEPVTQSPIPSKFCPFNPSD